MCECASPVSCPRMSWFSVGGMKGMNRTSLTWPLSKQGIYYLLTSYNDKSTMESERDYNIKKEREIETVSSWWTNKRQKKLKIIWTIFAIVKRSIYQRDSCVIKDAHISKNPSSGGLRQLELWLRNNRIYGYIFQMIKSISVCQRSKGQLVSLSTYLN